MSVPFVTSGPGKAMIFGEYVVLDGAPAIVSAVSRYATARWESGAAPTGPFVAAALAHARERAAAAGRKLPDGAPVVDSSQLYAGQRKLGLGSSAAVTVSAYGAALAAAGVALDEDLVARFRDCDAAHGEAQGAAGSGADVAAALWGGVLSFQRDRPQPAAPIAWPTSLALTLVDTGVAASTADRVARWRRLSTERPAPYRAISLAMRTLVDGMSAALSGATDHALDLVRRWNGCLEELAGAIDLEIVTPAHRRLDALAREHAGAAKPSGAGGGDLAVCFTPPDGTAPLRARLAREGFDVLDVRLAAPGLTCAPASDGESKK